MKKPYLLILLLIVLILPVVSITASAMSTGFVTEPMSDDDSYMFLANVNLSLLEEEPPKNGIDCFDVNKEGKIAVCQFASARAHRICVYSSDGTFLYGYSFNSSGTVCAEWDKENVNMLNIYFCRSDVLISVDPEGKVDDVRKVTNAIENNSYQNRLFHDTKRTVGDTKYKIRNKIGVFNLIAMSYSQIAVTNADGETTVIYDVNSWQFLITVLLLLGFLLIILYVIVLVSQLLKNPYKIEYNIFKYFKEKRRQKVLKSGNAGDGFEC